MYITIHNRKIHYKQVGKGEPLILLHGWGQNSYSLHHIAQKASKYFTVYSIDLPGFGKSDLPPKHWGLDGYAFLIKEFIRTKKLKCPHLMGHAFGASIAFFLASKNPHLLKSLVISSCPLHQHEQSHNLNSVLKRFPKAHPLLLRLYQPLQKILYRFFAKSSDLNNYPHLEPNLRHIISQDLSAFVSKIKQPTLILWGEDDTCTPVIYAYEMKNKIKNSTLCVIPQANHDIVPTHSQRIWQEMKAFLLS